MLVDLVSTTTSDGIQLEGALFKPAPGIPRQGPVDAILLMHGSRGNFYSESNVAMAQALQSQGYVCLSLNSTAHDNVWVSSVGNQLFGNAFDILDRCRLDIRAGIDCLWELGYQSIGLMGFSMGAVRVAYYAASEVDARVVTVVPISPVRLSYSYYMESADAEEFQGIIRKADQMEAEDRAMELIQVDFPISQLFSAASYLDKHGPAERYNLVTLASGIKVPIFVLGGSLETHTRLKDMARDLALAAVNSPRSEHIIIEGGNHGLNNKKQEASEVVFNWLASLSAQRVVV